MQAGSVSIPSKKRCFIGGSEHYFSEPESKGLVRILDRTVELFQYRAQVMGENKYFWRADYRGVPIISACDTKQDCLEQAKRYLKKCTR